MPYSERSNRMNQQFHFNLNNIRYDSKSPNKQSQSLTFNSQLNNRNLQQYQQQPKNSQLSNFKQSFNSQNISFQNENKHQTNVNQCSQIVQTNVVFAGMLSPKNDRNAVHPIRLATSPDGHIGVLKQRMVPFNQQQQQKQQQQQQQQQTQLQQTQFQQITQQYAKKQQQFQGKFQEINNVISQQKQKKVQMPFIEKKQNILGENNCIPEQNESARGVQANRMIDDIKDEQENIYPNQTFNMNKNNNVSEQKNQKKLDKLAKQAYSAYKGDSQQQQITVPYFSDQDLDELGQSQPQQYILEINQFKYKQDSNLIEIEKGEEDLLRIQKQYEEPDEQQSQNKSTMINNLCQEIQDLTNKIQQKDLQIYISKQLIQKEGGVEINKECNQAQQQQIQCQENFEQSQMMINYQSECHEKEQDFNPPKSQEFQDSVNSIKYQNLNLDKRLEINQNLNENQKFKNEVLLPEAESENVEQNKLISLLKQKIIGLEFHLSQANFQITEFQFKQEQNQEQFQSILKQNLEYKNIIQNLVAKELEKKQNFTENRNQSLCFSDLQSQKDYQQKILEYQNQYDELYTKYVQKENYYSQQAFLIQNLQQQVEELVKQQQQSQVKINEFDNNNKNTRFNESNKKQNVKCENNQNIMISEKQLKQYEENVKELDKVYGLLKMRRGEQEKLQEALEKSRQENFNHMQKIHELQRKIQSQLGNQNFEFQEYNNCSNNQEFQKNQSSDLFLPHSFNNNNQEMCLQAQQQSQMIGEHYEQEEQRSFQKQLEKYIKELPQEQQQKLFQSGKKK